MTNYQDYLKVGLKAAAAAGEIITKSFTSGLLSFETKSDRTPVTEVDKNCEALIKQIIQESFPDHAFLGEETGKSSNDSDFVWIIDPIDGTKNYVRGIPLFASLISLMYHGQCVVGISNAPILKEIVYASQGGGAFKNGQPIHVSTTTEIAQSYIGHAGIRYFTQKGVNQALEQIVAASWGARGFGDAWAYHLVAQGSLDANLEAKIKIWDIAAATAIITEAGGRVSDLEGKPIDINTTTFLATNGLIHDQVLNYFKLLPKT